MTILVAIQVAVVDWWTGRAPPGKKEEKLAKSEEASSKPAHCWGFWHARGGLAAAPHYGYGLAQLIYGIAAKAV